MSASPHAQRWPPHPLLLGLAACTLLLASVGVVVWWQDAPPVVVETDPRPASDRVIHRGISGGGEGTPHSSHEPAPPSALWEVERAEQLVVKELLKDRAR